MGLTNDGRDEQAAAIFGFSYTPFGAANCHLAVGDGTTAFDKTQSTLQGANTFRKQVDVGYPVQDPVGVGDDNVIRLQTTFEGTEANFTWEEVGIFNSSSGGVMLSRFLSFSEEKPDGETWVLQIDVTETN